MNSIGRMLAALLILSLAAPVAAFCASESVPDTAARMAAELDAQLAEKLGTEAPVKGLTMIVTTPADLDDLERAAPIARLIGEEMTAWFVAAGYRVTELRKGQYVLFKPADGEMLLTRRPDLLAKKIQASELILTGTYIGTAKYIRFNMRLIEASSGEVAAMSSGTLAISADTAGLVGEESYKAFARVRPSVGTRLPAVDNNPVQKTAAPLAFPFLSGNNAEEEQHPIYPPAY